jgi:hypothetical protein
MVIKDTAKSVPQTIRRFGTRIIRVGESRKLRRGKIAFGI